MNLRFFPRIGYPVLAICLAGVFLLPVHLKVFADRYALFDEGVLFHLAFGVLMLAALVPVASHRRARTIGLVLAVPVIFVDWILPRESGVELRLLAYFAFTTFVGVNMLRALLVARRADVDTICAAICLYLVAAFNWALLYVLIDLLAPGSFNLPPELSGDQKLQALIYYSFVTIATLGYGDILPLTEVARVWAAAETVFGQFFIAVVLARLVALQLTQSAE